MRSCLSYAVGKKIALSAVAAAAAPSPVFVSVRTAAMASSQQAPKVLTLDSINPNVKTMEYAVSILIY